MKEIKEEIKREVVDTHIYYEAIDGTRFVSKDECEKYEASANCVLKSRLKKLEVYRTNEWELFRGDEENVVIALRPTSQADVDTIMHAFLMDNPYFARDEEKPKKWLAERQSMADKALEDKDILLMGLNCNGELYFLDTRNNYIERLNNLDRPKEETKEEKNG